MPATPVTTLHNLLAGKGQTHLLSFVDSCTGPSNAAVWTVQCKIAGEVRGVGVAGQKATAKQLAAQQALDAIQADAS
ncbi:hypothetical protein E4T56_gene173 [Termitomyces sp. T112]|nr:hypothetical protein E4T56_gene173 [Termitomyces sp. T112]KAH0591217.1 hypothetical protein H2248_001310 [Termitomyces sp. 'cryptogamus']